MKKHILSLLTLACLLFSMLTSCIQLTPPLPDESAPTGNPPSQSLSEAGLQLHFIDVGQADAILVSSQGKHMLVDGGNVEDSSLVYSYLKKHNVEHLDYVVCTHAHEDHVGGLSGALSAATASKVLAPVTDYDSKAFRNFVAKATERGCTVEIPTAGTVFQLGGATVTVVGPLKQYNETNDTSIVLRIVYGETSFLLTGDMETEAEADLLDAGVELRSTLLKLGHHGSSTSTSYRFLRKVAPTYGVISVGTGNSYGHPNDEVLSRLRDADVTLYRTDLQGDVICSSDGKALTFSTQKGSTQPTNPTETEKTPSDTNAATEYGYIGNLNTKKFHLPTCAHVPQEQNRIFFITREEAVGNGYAPCGTCKP